MANFSDGMLDVEYLRAKLVSKPVHHSTSFFH